MKLILICFLLITSSVYSDVERRMAIDIGSGSTKFAIADVDLETNQVVNVILEDSIPVPYQKHLQAFDGSFDEEVQKIGLEAFQKIKKLQLEHQVQKVKAVATEAFRNAINAEEYSKEVLNQTGFEIEIIPQKQEGILAFYSAAANSATDINDMVVWDIGTGSLQIMTLNEKGNVVVFMQPLGAVPIRDYIIEVIKQGNVEETQTPNPLDEDDMKAADVYIRSIARKAYPIIKDKIADADRQVYGIGRLFYNGVGPLMADPGTIERDSLREFIRQSLNKADEEFSDPNFANVDLSNSILVLGFMKALQIHEVKLLDTTTAKGILSYSDYWQ